MDYAAKAVSWVVFLVALFYILPEYRDVLSVSAALFGGYVLEFGIIYNDPVSWYKIGETPIPVGYSTFAVVCFILFFVYKLLKG